MTAYNASGNLSAAAPAAKSTVAAITQPTYTLKSQPGKTSAPALDVFLNIWARCLMIFLLGEIYKFSYAGTPWLINQYSNHVLSISI